MRAQQRVVVAGDTHQLMRLLEVGRIDAYPSVPLSSAAHAGLYGPNPTLRRLAWFENSPATEAGLLLSLRTLDETTRATVARAIRDMKEDGTITAILARHIPDKKQVQAMLRDYKSAGR